jgi:hypothetical protein
METKLRPVREFHPQSVRQRPQRLTKSGRLEWLQPPIDADAALGDAIAWIAGAIAYRIGVDWWISLAAQAWLPGILVLIAPAMLAVGLSTAFPKLSLLLGYRLVLVMVGLLIGGRL